MVIADNLHIQSVDQSNQLLLHFHINLTVSGESTTTISVTRERSHESRILHLLVQVADESLSSGMTGCHITDRLQFLFMSELIKKYDLSVNLKMFENLAYVLIVPCEVELRNKPVFHILVPGNDSLCLLIERYTNDAWSCAQCILLPH